jgi:hypothetical protein
MMLGSLHKVTVEEATPQMGVCTLATSSFFGRVNHFTLETSLRAPAGMQAPAYRPSLLMHRNGEGLL